MLLKLVSYLSIFYLFYILEEDYFGLYYRYFVNGNCQEYIEQFENISKTIQASDAFFKLASKYFGSIFTFFSDLYTNFFVKIHSNISFFQYFQFLIFFLISLYFLLLVIKVFLKYLFIFIYNRLQKNAYLEEYFELPRLNQETRHMEPHNNQFQVQPLNDNYPQEIQRPALPRNNPPSYEHIYTFAEQILNTYNNTNH